eukprot:Nk52_evm1s1903 gene=Nk52_evmTU1s1903
MVLEPGTLVFVQKRKLNFKHDTPFDGPFEVVKLVPGTNKYELIDFKSKLPVAPVDIAFLKRWNVSPDDAALPSTDDAQF